MSGVLVRCLLLGAVFFGTVIGGNLLSLDEERKASNFLEFIEWDLEAEDDGCDNYQTTLWAFLEKPQDEQVAAERVEAMVRSAALQKEVAIKAQQYLGQEFRTQVMARRMQIMANPGAALLRENDAKLGAEFTVAAEQKLKAASNYSSAFSTVKDDAQLQSLWAEWQEQLNPSKENYKDFLGLSSKVASLNRERDLENFWEMQSDWNNGYAIAQKLWAELEPLYLKFHGYVQRRLQKFHENVPHDIPIHLLGSPEGIDWSYISKEALLQEELMKSLESSISQQDKKQLYILAEQMSQDLGLPELSRSFLEESDFNGVCPPEVIFACGDEGVRFMTCNTTAASWVDYLEAHENVFRASYFTLAARTNSYIFRHGNRYSAIPEAMSGLGALLAIANVVDAKLVGRDLSDPHSQALNLRMLVALKTLPRLPYLLGVDLCRMRDASNPSHPLPPYCWQMRTKMQRVTPPDTLKDDVIYDLFADRAVVTNNPRLSEFAGTIIQFQLYEYLTKVAGTSRRDLFKLGIKKLQVDDAFRAMLRIGLTQPWPEALGEINITDISTAPLLKFFKPLLPIFDDMAPMATVEPPDYEDETESPPEIESSSVATPTTKSSRTHQSTESNVETAKAAVTTATPTNTSDDTATESNLATDEENNMNMSQPTTIIAIGGILLGVVIVVAAIFIVNRRRKSQPELRKTSNGAQYEAVIRRSVGRPASFSPVVAKRLSENGNATPLPVFSTFRNSTGSPDVESPTETIILEETEAK